MKQQQFFSLICYAIDTLYVKSQNFLLQNITFFAPFWIAILMFFLSITCFKLHLLTSVIV